MENFETYIINLDSNPNIPKVKELNGLKIFCTSSSVIRVSEVMKKLTDGGLELTEDQVWTSSKISAQFIKAKHPECKKIRVVGEEPLFEELT